MKYRKLKNIGLLALIMGFHGTVLAADGEQVDPPRILMFFGRFHPVLLHLPIGALLITFYLDVIGRIRKDYPKTSIVYGLGFSAFFAVISSVLGYFLSLEDGYEGDVLNTHLWLGVSTAILTCFLFITIKSEEKWSKKIFFPAFVITLILISITGHYGSRLTHGDKFLTEYMGPEPKQKVIKEVDSLQIYGDVVAKILDDKCIQCHNPSKKKSGLSLVSPEMILKGGENGEIVAKNNADESALYKSAFLPMSDDGHMPPEGKKQLTKNELWLIKFWIDHELDFNSKVSNLPGNDSLALLLTDYLVFEKRIIPRASESAMQDAREVGFRLNNIVQGEAGLSLKYLNPVFDKKALNSLLDLKHQVIELDLSKSNLNDKMTSSFGKFSNLEKLRIDNTEITDKTLDNLKELKHLKVLNLHNTKVSDKGLENLLAAVIPENIFIWNTGVDNGAARQLSEQYKTVISSGVFDGFIEKTALKQPVMRTEKTLFTDTLAVELDVEMKEAIIRYTLDGNDPDSTSSLYSKPILIEADVVVKSKAFKNGWYPSETLQKDFYRVKHQVAEYTIVDEPEVRYPGSSKLFDLKEGGEDFKDGRWTGFLGFDLNTTVDLKKEETISKISVNCLENLGNWIMLPTELELYVSNEKESGYKKVGEFKIKGANNIRKPFVKRYSLEVPETTGRFFKIIVRNPKVLPSWHDGAGKPPWIFIDEIILW